MPRPSDSVTPNAAIVLVGDDAAELGRRAALLRDRGLRVALWTDDLDVDAVVEMANELFPAGPDDSVR